MDQSALDDYLRIAVVGNVDSGKSTLVGVLSKSFLDDGRGGARVRVCNFKHEANSGRTSSIGYEIMGFDKDGVQRFPEHFNQNRNKYWPEVIAQSKKVISLIDLCGHEKYLKTTMLGLTATLPDYVMIIVGANSGVSKMTKEHLGIALALKIPFFVVVTKVDMVPPEVREKTIDSIVKILQSSLINKKAIIVNSGEGITVTTEDQLKSKTTEEDSSKSLVKVPIEDKMISASEEELIQKAVQMIKSERICPVFQVSSLSGFGFAHLTRYLYLLKSRMIESKNFDDASSPVQVDLHERYVVSGAGLVVSGLVRGGTVRVGLTLTLGPDRKSQSKQVIVKSIHFNRVPVEFALPGQFCCFGLKLSKKKEDLDKKDFRNGIVLLDHTNLPKYAYGFQADISILHHATTIKPGYECVMHCGVVRQNVHLLKMDKELLRTGDVGKVVFKFMYNEEYLKPNSVFLLREGRTKVLGVISKIYTEKDSLEATEARE